LLKIQKQCKRAGDVLALKENRVKIETFDKVSAEIFSVLQFHVAKSASVDIATFQQRPAHARRACPCCSRCTSLAKPRSKRKREVEDSDLDETEEPPRKLQGIEQLSETLAKPPKPTRKELEEQQREEIRRREEERREKQRELREVS